MLTSLTTAKAALTTKAIAPVAPLLLSTNKFHQWLQDNVVTLILAVVGIFVLVAAKKKDVPGALMVVLGVLIGLSLIFSPESYGNMAHDLAGLFS